MGMGLHGDLGLVGTVSVWGPGAGEDRRTWGQTRMMAGMGLSGVEHLRLVGTGSAWGQGLGIPRTHRVLGDGHALP